MYHNRPRRPSATPEDVRFFGAGCACVAAIAVALCAVDSLTGHSVSGALGIRNAIASVSEQAASQPVSLEPRRITLAALTDIDPIVEPDLGLASVPDLAALYAPAAAALPPAATALPAPAPVTTRESVAAPSPGVTAPVVAAPSATGPVVFVPTTTAPLTSVHTAPAHVTTAPVVHVATAHAGPEAGASSAPAAAHATAAIPLPLPAPRRSPPPPTPAQRLGLDGRARAKAEGCLARAIYFEARGERKIGQVAVAQVVMNRVFSPYYPNDVCGVVYQNARRHLACQFTFACDGKSKRITEPGPWATARHIAKLTLDGKIWIPQVAKATHYHAVYVHPIWTREMHKLVRYGIHNFYRPWNWGDGRDETTWSNVVHTAARAKFF